MNLLNLESKIERKVFISSCSGIILLAINRTIRSVVNVCSGVCRLKLALWLVDGPFGSVILKFLNAFINSSSIYQSLLAKREIV